MPNQRRNIAVRKHTKGRRKLLTIEKRVIYLLLSAWLNVKGSWLNTKHPSRFAGSNPAALAFFFKIVVDNSPFSDIVPNMKRTIRAFNIKYDTEGRKIDLPEELFFEVGTDFDADNELADLISDKTGWCVFSCECEEIAGKYVDILTRP